MAESGSRHVLGIIGGSGLYDMPDLVERTEQTIETPFGEPSDAVTTGRIGEQPVVFLSRHGRGHRLSPTTLPYRANIYAMKALGVTHLLSVSAVGSLREEYAPRHLCVPDQLIDRTVTRERTFFDQGVVAHIGIADPFERNLRQALLHAAGGTGATVHDGGTYVCIEGPQFSTRAESHLYRSWGASIIGMTAMPEARLAREAELAYATLAMVTDYDVWHDSEAEVSVAVVEGNLKANIQSAIGVIGRLVANGLPQVDDLVANGLGGALNTRREAIQPADIERLGVIAARYLG
ncbi:MAG TPA: S-methyl-5'-thioadenosine phosphorylase [Thermomicrobiales bacterium]|nr:S-methyl-5'-thioadenosine phosphorylase [Thermomicrobiales bacterium]